MSRFSRKREENGDVSALMPLPSLESLGRSSYLLRERLDLAPSVLVTGHEAQVGDRDSDFEARWCLECFAQRIAKKHVTGDVCPQCDYAGYLTRGNALDRLLRDMERV